VAVEPANPIGRVPYIILELAQGDIRSYLDALDSFDLAWVLRSLHHTAAALQQLHMVGIAHQDVKPSNVLVIRGDNSKLADLGRSSHRGISSPADNIAAAGDRTYAPPERLYDYQDSNWTSRRFGCDAYLLGALTSFHFTRTSVTAQLMARLDPQHRWTPHRFEYPDYLELLPYIETAFGDEIQQIRQHLPIAVRDELTQVIRELCDPDPRRRGHPRNRGASNPYSLQQYVSIFNRLAVKARFGLNRSG
jgi:serine/threonine protein kinase